jgi:hypothetical protein
MGLGYHMVEALIRERQHRAIGGDVMLIGRQTVYFRPEAILSLLSEHRVDVSGLEVRDIEIDRSTTSRHASFANQELITDAALFRLLGAPKVIALDHSDYEGAEIVHDLTQPIPDRLRGCADFIVDGSTLDNVFDPVMVISNFAEMLRPGGRLITINAYSNHNEPYVILPPLWYLDFFTVNRFLDCKVYIVAYGTDMTPTDIFTIDTDRLMDPTKFVSAFKSDRMMGVIVLAEKGVESTSSVRPTQQHYRSPSDWSIYRDNLSVIRKHPRPHLVRSKELISVDDVQGGHLFIASDFTQRDPGTEIKHRKRQHEVGSPQ